ncbi:MAG: UPF0182 family protein [Acidimicrobiia bacterium]|nr:UPF0182 family protein [Acidimicrobiia bacterium]
MYPEIPGRTRTASKWRYLLIVLFLLLIGARTIANTVIEYHWWKEMGQVAVWLSLLAYGVAPVAAASLLAFAVFWIALARGLKFSGGRMRSMPVVARVGTLIALLAGIFISSATIDTWAVIRFFGSRGLNPEIAPWQDPVFSKGLPFYLFDLPFFNVIRQYFLAVSLGAAVIYWLSARLVQLRDSLPQMQQTGEIDLRVLRLEGGLESKFLRGAVVVFLLAMAAKFYLDRYGMLMNEHGFMVGVDYVDEKIRLPLQWAIIAGCLLAPAAVLAGKWRWLIGLAGVLALQAIVPRAVSALYVRPNEISIQRPYIEKHIEATRHAYGLTRRVKEAEFTARMEARIDQSKHKPLLDNVRLWDWRAFHDTVTQIQALRPYYVFADSDVDRYVINGNLRQMLLTPRELDIRQLPDARTRWINPHFIYTHGYGMVMAEANRITTDGLPNLFVQDAPTKVLTESLQLKRPEIYYGEVVHEPVFVRTGEKEFSYPEGNTGVFTRYEGTGGFPISSPLVRLMAAVREADPNILLTSILTSESRMMIRRNIRRRLAALAEFVTWDDDPYLVLTDEGHLVWTVDGYTTSTAHPYSQRFGAQETGQLNYIRNSVKATVDAYNGDANLYIFDAADPIILSYQKLFPTLLKPASAMPASLRKHARYPETFFRVQAEIYRTYHMTDPQAFYNKEDVWDIARNIYGQESRPQTVQATYVVATLPGEKEPEFLLILPFTPRNKDNLIGVMVARCDGESLGELHFLQLSKQALIFGPMQIEARINQDQNISKDLTLWNQQGSQVLRGQMLVLPVEDTFLYVEPIYIQASEARMPQLKKVVLAVGDQLIYENDYDQALASLARISGMPAVSRATEPVPTPQAAGAPVEARRAPDPRVEQIREQLRRYRENSAQGKWVEAGKAMEAIEALLQQR